MFNPLILIALLVPMPPQSSPPGNTNNARMSIQSPTVRQSIKDGYPLMGEIHFEAGAEPAIVNVELRDSDELTVLDTTTSNPNGRFRFNGVKYGRYWLVIESERYVFVKQRLEVDFRSFGIINVDISLYPKVTREGAAVVSLAALSVNVPDKALHAFEDALKDFQKGKEDKGIERMREALEIAPDFYDAHVQLGFAYQRGGMASEAIAELEQAVALNPASPDALSWLGRLYYETEQFERALPALEARLKLGGGSADDHFFAGSAYYKTGDFDGAERNLLRAVALAPAESGPSRLQLFNVYMRVREPVTALEQLDIYLEEFPDAADHAAIKARADQLREMLKGRPGA